MKLFLDDERQPQDVTWLRYNFDISEFVIVRTVEQAIDVVNNYGFPEFVSFDHDLGHDEKPGKAFAHYLINHDLDFSDMPSNFNFAVHSKNPVGEQNIRLLMDAYMKHRNYGASYGI